MAKLNPVLKPAANRFNSAVASVVGFDFTILLQLLPIFTQLFALCKKQPPPNPVANPTKAGQKAYEMNWHATTNWVGGKEHYKSAAINQTAKSILKSKKKNGESISKDESRQLAIAALDEARLNDVATLTVAIQENGG